MKRRLAAIAALRLMAASTVLAAVLAVQLFPRGLTVFACIAVAVAAAWWALLRRSLPRLLGAGTCVLLLVGAILLIVLEGRPVQDVLVAAGIALSLAAARAVFAVHTELPAARPPARPVLFYNPKSGGGSRRLAVGDDPRMRLGCGPRDLACHGVRIAVAAR